MITVNQQIELFEIALIMDYEGHSREFITRAVRVAIEIEDVYDMVVIWPDEAGSVKQERIANDLKKLVDKQIEIIERNKL